MTPLQLLIFSGLLAVFVLAGDFALRRLSWRRLAGRARAKADRLLANARREAAVRRKDADLAAQELKERLETEAAEREGAQQARLDKMDEDLSSRQEKLQREESRQRAAGTQLARDQEALTTRVSQQDERAAEIARREESVLKRLEEIAGLTRDQALERLRAELVEGARVHAEEEIHKVVEKARASMEERIGEALSRSLQHVRSGGTVESTVSVVRLPSDDMKGSIIGREGRNIRSIEMVTGIDLIVDDTPGTITLSCFDPLRRETARVAIERLLEDGRIHPARIEELVEKTRKDMKEVIRETGETTAFELAVQDLHPRLAELLGLLKYHTVQGQNVLQHCRETADLAGVLAQELGIPPDVPRRAGLLHEIAQASEEQLSAPTILASGELAMRHGESRDVQQAIASAHQDVTPRAVEGALVRLACRLSHSRLGARKHNLEVFMGRLRRLEKIALSYPGVRMAYVFRAGKELRVLVDNQKISDREAVALSREIASRLKREADLPGEIKVSVLRETRAVDFAL